ncbi:MAG: hypothetical protein A2487_06280 [Candidatus Raymondbacteria bacterium RifOxyC12_full_50_8]|uniref:Uncharacterized protein n=1 Tax=Candidatus Raymondbacteria bacterium RIFOXYD12_FULL_49_13 TaxID=1817890 RepID=A0A1F7FC54_UNCRA|nr:MAG: hypothetical protein A2248_03180 [Candidatus Raymondbacteria bacterium RIFOXYA2_FULL_49_16]OGJ93298.1 MAG: hypothetical protein A2350_14615 [Candidatus Raymondbacteria bacterium RifOxyB12_full_50_8]OGK04259.1 MAG: hypothetical protein A2519_18025 [Candidatus Raymondbacteria bacterium RIFOXYD12_FULL_49_13]OGK06055.1 MAG: hypothetical protein A2487_06280 [Candidatus Raymondbacteria bacterium RifOxyC12_full_50_8]OGP42458.1 MAG: hypothetical protein A2324_17215 [Candidatus Raymondbacteria b
MEPRIKVIVIALAGILAFNSCDVPPPVQPDPENYTNSVQVTVVPAYYYTDGTTDSICDVLPVGDGRVWQENVAFKIFFTRASGWDPDIAGDIIMYNIYKKAENSDNRILVARSFGEKAGRRNKDTAITYRSHSGKLDSVWFDSVSYVYDVLNTNAFERIQYGVRAVTNLNVGMENADFSRGQENAITYSPPLGGGVPERFIINNGALNTFDNAAVITGQFDTAGLSAIVYCRYSEILPLDSLSTYLFRIVRNKDSLGFNQNFQIGANTVYLRADSSVILSETKGTATYFYAFGRLGRVDTVYNTGNQLNAFFDSSFMPIPGSASSVSFAKTDTLVTGLGKKWVVVKGVWPGSYRKKQWTPLFDDISIRSAYAEIKVDRLRAAGNIITNSYEDKWVLLGKEVPFLFDTFGDPTFQDTVQVWLATRNLVANFFTGSFQIDSFKVHAIGRTYDSLLADCIFETPPQKHLIDELGVIKQVVSVNDTLYHVSPLARKSGTGVFSLELRNGTYIPERGNLNPIDIALCVKPGSILGYGEADTNQFGTDTVFSFASDRGLKVAFLSAGWHISATTPARIAAYTATMVTNNTKSAIPELVRSYDNTVYRNPFQNLPLHVSGIKNGGKEFVLLAFSRGKYFNEPRVYISSFSTATKYMWDKVAPHATWSPSYDPKADLKYAPLYTSSKATNLTQLGNIFDVFLRPDETAAGNAGLGTGIRDVGAGKIVSVELCFHPKTTNYTSDPITGLRVYSGANATPVKRYVLSIDQLTRQQQVLFGAKSERKTWAISEASFLNINATQWSSGIWEMWVETEDDLGNRGMAPYGGKQFSTALGNYFVREIKIE